jgi:hypothetical protein
MKLLHIINDLDPGGAEKILYKILSNSLEKHFVVSLKKNGLLLNDINKLNIKYFYLNINNPFTFCISIYQYYFILKDVKPDIIQTWLYKSDLFGGFFAYIFGYRNIYWNLRNNKASNLKNFIIIKILSFFSYFIPKKIICCSNSAIVTHHKYGYDKKKFYLIYNGYELLNTNKYISKDNKIFNIANISRWNKVKNHIFILKLAKYLKNKTNLKFKIYLYGSGLTNENKELINIINNLDIKDEIILKGYSNNLSNDLKDIDLHILTSLSESFPNVVAETMFLSIPNISTNVGDVKNIIKDTGWIIDNYNIKNFASVILLANNERIYNNNSWKSRKNICFERIKKYFDKYQMLKKYEEIWNLDISNNQLLKLPKYFENLNSNNLSDLTVIIPSVGNELLYETIKHLNLSKIKPKKIIISLPLFLKNKFSINNYDNIDCIYNKKYDQISQRLNAFKKVETKYVLQLDEDTLIDSDNLCKLLNSFINLNNDKIAMSPVFYNIDNKKPIHRYNFFYFKFLNDLFFHFLFGARWQKSRDGTIAKSGINFGVQPPLDSDSLKKVEWLPGGCLLQFTKNINNNFLYKYDGKAYCEDLINSYIFSKNNIKMFVDVTSFCMTEKPKLPKDTVEFNDFLKLFSFYNNLYNNNSLYLKFYKKILIFRHFLGL